MTHPTTSPTPIHHPSGLRRKIGGLLLVISISVLLLSMIAGQRIMQDLTTDLSRRLALSEAQLTREKIQALVGRELAIAQRFADLTALDDWLLDEQSPTARRRFLTEASRFRPAFSDQAYFIIHHRTLAYYYADQENPRTTYRYTLKREKPEDAWYFAMPSPTRSASSPPAWSISPR